MEKLTTPISARFTETEANECDAMAQELKPGLFVGLRTGRSAVLRLSWLVTRRLIASGILRWDLDAIQEFLSQPSLQDGAALKFPPRTVSLLEEAGQLRLAVGNDVPPKRASLTGTNRQPLRFSLSQLKDRTAKESWVTSGVQFRTLLAGRVA